MEKSDRVPAEKAPVSEGRISFRDLIETTNTPETSAEKPVSRPSVEAEQPSGFENDQIVYELTDIVEEPPSKGLTVTEFNAEIMKKVSEIAEKIAREMIPDIVEAVIREEIEKLKAGAPPADSNKSA